MSYDEYFDIYREAQSRNCPFRAFCIDVVNSKILLANNKDRYPKVYKLFDYITIKLLEKNNLVQVLRNNKNNQLNLTYNFVRFNNDKPTEFNRILKEISKNQKIFVRDDKNIYANLIANPMITGDCACYLTNENTLSENEFLEIVKTAMEKFNIDVDFHFKSAKYETDEYAEGGKKLYKGYVFPILEKLSKTEGLTIKHNVLEK